MSNDVFKPIPHNCVNCGAVLHGRKCEYCGTEYGKEFGFVDNSILNTKSDDFPRIWGDPDVLEVQTISGEHWHFIPGQDEKGRIIRKEIKKLRKDETNGRKEHNENMRYLLIRLIRNKHKCNTL